MTVHEALRAVAFAPAVAAPDGVDTDAELLWCACKFCIVAGGGDIERFAAAPAS